MDSEEEAVRRKVVLVGDSETGKTSLVFRVTNVEADLPKFSPTIIENQIIRSVHIVMSRFSTLCYHELKEYWATNIISSILSGQM